MKYGFSLVELSIVLVILGLLTGGILAGQSLIRASELRAVTTELSKHKAAANTFRDKYFGVPGDVTTATKFWGATNADPAVCIVTVGSGTQTCNGNGDGYVTPSSSGATHYSENFTFWQHLTLAGLMEGTYTGRIGPGGTFSSSRDNVPPSKLPNGFWFAFVWNTSFTGTAQFDGNYQGNMFQLGSIIDTVSSPGGALLKPEELWNVDTKLDDGKPGTGVVRARFWAGCSTATASSQTSADYTLTTASPQCVMLSWL